MKSTHVFLSLTILSVPFSTRADEFRVENETLPIPFSVPAETVGEPPKIDREIEASAIQAIGDGRFVLVAHDRSAALYVVETASGRTIGKPITCDRFPNDATIPPKWEGLARDDSGWFYVTGTFGGKADEDRAARSFLFRFRLTGDAIAGNLAIDNSTVRRWDIAAALKDVLGRELTDPAAVDKRKVEGLTVRSVPSAVAGNAGRLELIFGLREPGDLVRTFVADISKTPEDGAVLALSPLFSFYAGSREGVPCQLTSLEYVPQWHGFLIVTATEDDQNVFHGNTLWILSDVQIGTAPQVKPVVAHVFEPAMKAEGLTILADGPRLDVRSIRLAVSFDNDPHATHIPSRLQILTLSRRGQ